MALRRPDACPCRSSSREWSTQQNGSYDINRQFGGQWYVAFNLLVDGSLAHSNLGYLNFFIAAQNMAIFIRRETTEEVVIEAFEVSAKNEDVLAAGALVRAFPGRAIAMNSQDFFENTFQTEFATFLERASSESIDAFASHSKKVNTAVSEIRDTVNPALIIQMLMSILEALGTCVSVSLTIKRMKDEVSWSNALEPWRRSPMWLVTRVAFQRTLHSIFGPEQGISHYKNFTASFLAKIVETATESPAVSVDFLQFLCAKLSRRILKLQNLKTLSSRLETTAEATLAYADRKIMSDLANIIRQTSSQIRLLPHTAQPTSLKLSLDASDSYLCKILDTPFDNQQVALPEFDCINRHVMTSHGLPAILPNRLPGLDCHLTLFDAEHWVREELQSWMSSSAATEARYSALAQVIQSYSKIALDACQSDCAQLFTMLLTVMDIWVVLDRLTTELYPLLKQYHPEVKPALFHALEVESAKDMRRLQRIEAHVNSRILVAEQRNPSMFCDPHKRGFAYRYFEGNAEMKEHLKTIKEQATMKARAKRTEWASMNQAYTNLMSEINASTCTMKEIWSRYEGTVTVHNDGNCRTCSLRQQAQQMRIEVFEFPLPENMVSARTAVFELDCPNGFAAWRDTTWMILRNLGSDTIKPVTVPYTVTLSMYPALAQERSGEHRRLTLASQSKSWLVAHYREMKFPCTVEDVCKPNGLIYEFYDSELDLLTNYIEQEPTFEHHCALKFSSVSQRHSLLPFVNSTKHTPNGS